jgi:hypothetical protein
MGYLKLTNETFKERARQIHGNKYDYSKVEYGKNNKEKVCIICPEHGEFWQSPNGHLHGYGCPYCCRNKKITQKEFIEKVNSLYKGKYDFSQSVYVNTDTKVKCICQEHGEFWQTPHHLLKGVACERCGRESMSEIKIKKSAENFEKKAKKVHGDKYDYSKVKYTHNQNEVCIICPEHGEFWQKPSMHLFGHGCPICNSSKLEMKVRFFLTENNIKFEEQKKFEWLKCNGYLRLDFYLPEYNVAIECQGEQHFKPVKYFGGNSGFLKTINRDKKKNELCEKNGIKIIYFSEKKYPGMLTDLNKIKKIIL